VVVVAVVAMKNKWPPHQLKVQWALDEALWVFYFNSETIEATFGPSAYYSDSFSIFTFIASSRCAKEIRR